MKRHSTDLLSLVFGVIFLGVAGWWLAGQYVTVNVPHLGWITAAVLIVLGVLGLAGSLRGERPAATPVTAPTSGPTVEMAPIPPAPTTFNDRLSMPATSGETAREESETPREDAAGEDTPHDAPSTDEDNGTNFR